MIEEIFSNIYITACAVLTFSFISVYLILPKISWMVNHYNLNDKPNERSSHDIPIPTMGGLAFFITLILTIFFINGWDTDSITLNIFTAMTMIFAIGLKDDLSFASVKARLIVEFIAISIIFFHDDMHMITFDGFLGIYSIPQVITDVICILIFLTIINSFNLIDGVNGLAATIGIVIFSIFAHIFFKAQLYFYFLLCISFIGILFAFLRYNFSSNKNIFMGDTGSLIIGFFISILSLKFLSIDTLQFTNFKFIPENKFIVLGGILFIPLFDLIRVFGVRILHGKSPFVADRNHFHHILNDLGKPHYRVSLLLGFVNYCFSIFVIYLSSYFNSYIMLVILISIFILFCLVAYMLKMNRIKIN